MREILFRAKDEASHKWVYGYYVHLPSAAGSVHIMQVPAGNPDENNTAYYIIPETVGEYTGLTDKNGKKIFEGDIIKHYGKSLLGDPISDIGVVTWDCDECFLFRTSLSGKDQLMSRKDTVEVLGNIHDNPELVEGDADDQP